LLAAAESKGWREAMLTSSNPKIKDLYLFTDCPSRADGSFYLSLTRESSVLDLGSGLGSYTFALSPRVKEIMAADTNFESLRFISLRARQDGRKNITAAQIEPLDYGRLPFADKSFDAVIMNGVLEWVGAFLKRGDPLKIQQKCLTEVRRTLKPGGEVWIGIENRFGLRYFMGTPDDHLTYYSKEKKTAYTSLLPRFIASWITSRRLGRPYRTYTHSLWGLKRLLRRAGFAEMEFFFPEDDYRSISTKIIPLDSVEIRKIIAQRMPNKLIGRVVAALKLETALCDSYFIVARERR